MRIEALERFNGRDPGETWEAKKDDAEKWIKNGLARPAKKTADKKAGEGPPEDKAVKEPAKKK